MGPNDPLPHNPGRGGSLRPVLIVAGLVVALGVSVWLGKVPLGGTSGGSDNPSSPDQGNRAEGTRAKPAEPAEKPALKKPDQLTHAPGAKTPAGHPVDNPEDDPAGSFLGSFTGRDPEASGGPVPDNAALEKRWRSLLEETNVKRLNKELTALQADMRAARRARPDDPVVRWLTGELLLLVGGEPGMLLPYFRRAAEAGLDRPRLYASLTQAQLASNQFADAYASALKGVARGRDPYNWTVFQRAAFARHAFTTFRERLDQAFSAPQPAWVAALRGEAVEMEEKWVAEQKLRQADAKANLPRVRLVIEHRRFAKGPNGKTLSRVESTGTEEVVLELFEDQAPATVANFLSLVEKKFYDGTRFHLAAGGALVTGGDPKTKDADPDNDGSGGPGYAIPDEFTSPKARYPFGGALGMVKEGKDGPAGSMFFLTLVPRPEFAGHFTIFGRVLKGREAVDHITRGRTTTRVGSYGKIIPGDLLLRAEVIRKRPHEYRVIQAPK